MIGKEPRRRARPPFVGTQTRARVNPVVAVRAKMRGSRPPARGVRSPCGDRGATPDPAVERPSPVLASSRDEVRPGLVDQRAEPFEIRRPAGAAGVAHVRGDGAAGEFQVRLGERGGSFRASGGSPSRPGTGLAPALVDACVNLDVATRFPAVSLRMYDQSHAPTDCLHRNDDPQFLPRRSTVARYRRATRLDAQLVGHRAGSLPLGDQ
jgi:hypothetical protein